MPKDSKSGSTAGSEGSFGSKNSKIAPAGPPPEIEESADEVDGNAVELVVEGPCSHDNPHEDSEEELLQQMSNTYNTDDEDDPVAAALNAAAAQEEAARFSQRASYKGDLAEEKKVKDEKAMDTTRKSMETARKSLDMASKSRKSMDTARSVEEAGKAPTDAEGSKTARSNKSIVQTSRSANALASQDPRISSRSLWGALTARSKVSEIHQTVEDKTGTEISNEEEEEEENDVQFTYVACGATHTVLATHHGHMCLAFGNHKFGQLGIAERSVKPKVDICDECSTLQAFFECAECPSKEERDDETNQIEYRNIRFCESCWAVIHKQKKNRLHSQIRMKPPDKRKFRTNPVPVKTHECEKGDDQETDDMVGVGIGMESEVTNNTDSQYWPVVDLYNVTQIACGDSHTMAIVSSLRDGPGEVYSWGNGSSGRTGLTDIDNSPDTRDQFEACLIESQETVQDEESITASRAATERVEYQPLEARRIAAGGQHSLALTHDEETGTGCVLSWGSNEFGQLGRPIEDNHGRWTTIFDVVSFSNGDTYKIDLIACGDLHCLAVSKFGQGLSQLYSWGCAKNGRLGFECDGEFEPAPRPVGPPSKDRYVSISAGVCHSAALTRRKFLYCWGLNESGQCGFFNWGDTCRSCSIKPSKEYCCGPMTPKQLEEHIYHATTPNEDGIQSKDTKEYKDKTASKDVLKPTYVPFPADKAKKPTSVAIKSGSTPRTPVSGAKSGATPHLEEDDEGVLQVACGEQHTLALVGKNLWLLGSGLDQQYRRENMKIEKAPPGAKGLRDKIVYSKGFYPRTIELAFSDTAESTTKPAKTFDGDIQLNKEDDPGDAVRYTLTAIEWKDPKDPEKEPEIREHHCFTFTFGGDLDGVQAPGRDMNGVQKPGPVIAFTGPTAPIGFKLESAKDGPWFNVLGLTKWHQNTITAEKPWDFEMKPDHKPFFEYKVSLKGFQLGPDLTKGQFEAGLYIIADGKSDIDKKFKDPKKDKDAKNRDAYRLFKCMRETDSTKPYDNIERLQIVKPGGSSDSVIMTYMYLLKVGEPEVPKEFKFPDDLPKDPSAADKWQVEGAASWDVEARILASTLGDDVLLKDTVIIGSCSGAKFRVTVDMGRPELDSLQLNPVVRWVKTFEDEDQPTIYYNKQETKMKDGSGMTCAYVDYHSKNRVTVEVSEDVLTGNTKTYESVASWLTENVKGNNLQNMLVCLKAELPPLKQIASGHFHAAALTEDGKALVWGKGSLGRLGLGNELDQLVPTVIEMELGQTPVCIEIVDNQIIVTGPEDVYEKTNGGLMVDDLILDVQHCDVSSCEDERIVLDLLNGPIGTQARVTVVRACQAEPDEEPQEIVVYLDRVNLEALEEADDDPED